MRLSLNAIKLFFRNYAGVLSCVVCCFVVVACHQAPPPVAKRLNLKLTPASLGENISIQQHLKVERENKTDDLDAALEIDADRLELVGLAFGQRVLTVNFDGKEIKTWRHFMLPQQVKAEDVLEDIQLSLWPAEVIAQHLPAPWRISESGRERFLYQGDTLIMKITYGEESRWSGTVVLENFHYKYRLTIQTAKD
ncbi:DUF3261 domain-containing protein [Undibacterium sp. LX40W]|uniref:DUF3261 domain-containing protein n=1 Tax=Undibacterium nitidum TaxID=2762298 RepID=A0A923HJN7_9BURK|nr:MULTISPECIES: DUF3261 domain-containing protein [Undibacterium]MBC3880915.1 DUF3261 domain-containing protein [Undibacterium nitidum]MBC3890352.1 DUF3261 domain-containing protein [Undibacterium sp. LX40W]